MSVRIIESAGGRYAALYDSGSMWAFGPVLTGDDAAHRLAAFVKWLPEDARTYSEQDLELAYGKWLAEVDGE